MFDTRLPTRTDQDLNTFLESVLEKYILRFPKIRYKVLTHPLESASGDITSNSSVTVVDDLYGEGVPTELAGGFVQPHSDVTIDATSSSVYLPDVNLNVKVEWDSRNRTLTRYGRDVTQNMTFKFLNYQMEREGVIEISPGDKFIWKDHLYKVNTYVLRGRWMDTDYFIYSVATATMDQFGS